MPNGEKAKKTFTIVGRARDGKEVRKEPGEAVIRAITGEKVPGDQRGAIDIQQDPVLEEEGSARVIVGKDNRIRVKNTGDYPYSAHGLFYFIDTADPDGFYGCSATLVAPKIAVTTASCLYRHEIGSEGGSWNEQFVFWPGLNGNNDTPFGSYEYDTAYVFEGWITEYDGTWDSVYPYNLGVITFAEAVGDSTGYMGRWDFGDEADSLESNALDYPNDKKPANTMWQSTCTVAQQDAYDSWFANDCDVEATGGPVFVYDKSEDSRYIIGLQMMTDQGDESNYAMRLYGPIYEWIDTLSEE